MNISHPGRPTSCGRKDKLLQAVHVLRFTVKKQNQIHTIRPNPPVMINFSLLFLPFGFPPHVLFKVKVPFIGDCRYICVQHRETIT